MDFMNNIRHMLASRSRRKRSSTPVSGQTSFESLEVRRLMTLLSWSDTKTLTISFAPDGTDIAGNSSRLHEKLDRIAPRDQWQSVITSAFETWLSEVGLDLQVVSDSGDEFGIAGATHGDARFGDVRVGAVPLSDDALATAIPGDQLVSGTWASDVMFNSSVDLTTLDEVYALALHEAGHVLGLGHSNDPVSPMYAQVGTIVHQPTRQDLQNLRRQFLVNGDEKDEDDDWKEDDDENNNHLSGAQRMTGSATVGLDPHFEVTGEIGIPSDVDSYQFRPSELGQDEDSTATIVLETPLNGLIPRVSLVSSDGKPAETSVIANGNGRVVIQAKDVRPKKTYYLIVESATKQVDTSTGRYRLSVSFGQPEVEMDRLASGTIRADRAQQVMLLYSAKSQIMNFVLSAQGSSRQEAALVMTVYDQEGAVVYQTAARPGDTVTGSSVLLHPGEYRVAIQGVAAPEHRVSEMGYSIKGVIVSIDAGPLPSNTTLNPSMGNNGRSPYVFPNNVVSNRPINVQQPRTPPVLPPARPPIVWTPVLLQFPWLSIF